MPDKETTLLQGQRLRARGTATARAFSAAEGLAERAVVLRRTECYLVGSGQIVLGCAREEEDAPAITFSVKALGPKP